jgi:hypothetical protein
MPMGASATLDRVRRSTADELTDHSAASECAVDKPSGTRNVECTQTLHAGESPVNRGPPATQASSKGNAC